MLPDGRVFEIGSDGNTALYSPPALAGNGTGTWLRGSGHPQWRGRDRRAGAMMTNGDILFAVSPYMKYGTGNGDSGMLFNKPTTIDEYNPSTNTITVVPPNDSTNTPIPDLVTPARRQFGLCLAYARSAQWAGSLHRFERHRLRVPAQCGTQRHTDASSLWRPVIHNIKANADGSFTLTGTQINGLSEGATYGDDAQMASNYPIVAITTGGHTLYATTSTGVAPAFKPARRRRPSSSGCPWA